ncbi:MAG: TonB-dependent receptor, partial [Gammaproteobacteria bacterium]
VLTCKPGTVGGRKDDHPANFCGKATLTRPATYGAVGLPYNHLTHVAGYPGGEVGEYETKSDYNVNGIVQDFDRYTLEMTWDLSDNISLSSLTGSRDMYSRTYIDFGADEYGLFTRDRKRENNFTSQEFKLQGTVGDRIDWVGGVYYWDYYQVIRHDSYSFVDFRDDPDTVGTVEGAHLLAALAASGHKRPLSPGPKTAMDGFANTGLAWFGEVNFALGDKLDLSAGVRFNDEDHTAYGYTSTGTKLNPARPDVDMGGCVFCRTTKQTLPTTFESTTPRVALSYSASDDVMVYGSYAEGFGAGGIAAIDIPGLPASMSYDPEETQSFELGLRGNFLDGRFRLFATMFSTNWDKIQVSETLKDPSNPGQNLPEAEITNAGTASADGVEIEGRLLVSDALQLDFTVGMLDTAYTSLGQATQIKVGDTFRQAPELTWSIGLQHDTALTNGGTFTTRLDYGFVDDYVRVRESQRQTFQESYSKLNARFNYEPPEGDWRLSVFGTNLTDERYLNGGFLSTGFAFDLATVARPREVGASLEFFFD